MIDLSLGSLIAYAVFFVLGAFLGVLLGRRSKTANAYTDRILEESKELRDKLELAQAKLRDKAK